ncbi:hypothetical protein G6F57_021740 [Rhizopus arrhizus]|nr:hypothetical protein G6F57_021740 [Rhizopus arrhizus]
MGKGTRSQAVMVELSKKYHELENLSNKEMLENTIDAFMLKMEELDGKISDVLGRADKMRERVEEKLYEVAGAANEHIDKLKAAMTFVYFVWLSLFGYCC